MSRPTVTQFWSTKKERTSYAIAVPGTSTKLYMSKSELEALAQEIHNTIRPIEGEEYERVSKSH